MVKTNASIKTIPWSFVLNDIVDAGIVPIVPLHGVGQTGN